MTPSTKTTLAVMSRDIDYIKKSIDNISGKLASDYVTKTEFESEIKLIKKDISPLKKIIYTTTGVFGLAIIGAIAALVINTK